MTKVEKASKQWIVNKLAKEGYVTYSRILQNFDFNLTDDPNTVGYMIPNKGVIVINKKLDEDQVSVICRHEILHSYLNHEKRLITHLAKQMGFDSDVLLNQNIEEIKNTLYSNSIFNIAADYEISNRGYTDADKHTVRNININGRIVSGLVTEDQHPDWVDLPVEDMYDKLKEEHDNDPESNVVNGFLMDPTTFIDITTGVTYGI